MNQRLLTLCAFTALNCAAMSASAVTIDFTTHTTGANLTQGDLVLDFDIDGSGNVTATNSAGANITVTGTVNTGFNESFSITLDGTNSSGADTGIRVEGNGGGVGVQGRNAARISWHADDAQSEVMFITPDLSGISSGLFTFTDVTFGNYSGTPTARIEDFAGGITTHGPTPAGATLGGAGFELAAGSTGTIDFSNDIQSPSGPYEYAIHTLSFDLGLAAPPLELTVSRETGLATIANNSGADAELIGVSLLSSAGSLDPSDWQSLDENPAVAEPWETFAESDVELAEGAFDLSDPFNPPVTTFADSATLDMGAVHELGSTEDIQLQYQTASGEVITVDATYVDATDADLFAGDFNDDGVVDAADYTVWRDNLGAEVALANETVSLGAVTIDDYQTWVENFGAVEGGSIIATPEPSSLLLALAGVVAGLRRRR